MTLGLILVQAIQRAQPAPELAPGTRHPKIPTLRRVVGHHVRLEITTPE